MRNILIVFLSLFITSAVADEKWRSFVTDAHNYLTKRQDILTKKYKLGEHKRFDWDQKTGSLVFSNDGIPAVVAKIQFVGSISTVSNTWLWSRENPTVLGNVKDKMNIVKRYGKKEGFDALTTKKWKANEVDGWEMTSITAKLLKAKGAYRTSSKNGFIYMVITDIHFANK